MLKFIRRNAEAAWVKFMFVAIVVVFVFWGMGGIVGSRQAESVVRVNNDRIDPLDYARAYNNMLRFYQNLYKDNFKPELVKAIDLKQRAADQLIQDSLMQQEARRIGLRVGAAELRDTIAALPAFREEGGFNKQLYVRVLRANNLTPEDFEDAERQELLVKKLQELITAGVHVSEAEVHARYVFDNDKVSLRVVKLDPTTFLNDVHVSDQDVQTYYEAHQDAFREPERLRLEYVLYPVEKFAAKVQISDTAVKQYYTEHLSDFAQPEEVRARHILFKLAPDASAAVKARVRKRAEAVLAKVKAGGDFAALAKRYSEDASAAAGGDLGFFARGKMVKPFEDAAFALQPGQTSGIVETPFGLHIIKVDAKKAAHTATLDEVRAQIVAKLRDSQAHDLARTQAETDRAKVAGGQTLATVAAAEGLKVATSAPFARTEPIEGIGPSPDLVKAAFATDAGALGPVVETADGACLFRVAAKIAAHVSKLADVHDKAESQVRLEKATALAQSKAATLLQALQKHPDLDAVAKSAHLQVEETPPFARGGGYIPSLGDSTQLKKAAFALTAKQPVAPAVYTVAGDSVLAVLKERVPADESAFKSQKDTLMQQALQQRKNQALEEFLNYLKAHATIRVNKDYLAGIPDNGSPLETLPGRR